jgi:hypothetical protein
LGQKASYHGTSLLSQRTRSIEYEELLWMAQRQHRLAKDKESGKIPLHCQRRQRNDDGSGSDNKADHLEGRNDDIDEEQVIPQGVFDEGIRTIEASNMKQYRSACRLVF